MEYVVRNSKELIDAINADGSKKVILKKGEYSVNETLYLSDNTEIVGEKGVTVNGATRISLTGIKPCKGIYKIKLADFGITNLGEFGQGPYGDFWTDYDIPKPHMENNGPSLELYYGKKKMNLSRYPQKGFATIKKSFDEIDENNKIISKGRFVPCDKKVFDENNVDNMLLVGYWNWDWATQRHTIKSYDKRSGELTVNEPYHIYGYSEKRGMFYILNVKSCVNKPGDWYIDRTKGELWMIPYKNQNYVDVTVCENIFECKDAENVIIKNLNLLRCRKSAIRFENCKNAFVDSCVISNVGAWGIIADNCTDSKFSNCIISHTGGGGIACSGGNRDDLTHSRNIICHNTISNVAHWHKTYLAAIEINGVGVNVSFNKIFDVPHFGIVFQGNNHIIENNDIGNACYESNDAGAIYAGRDYTCRGNIIRYNYLHDMLGYGNKGCVGVYFDDGMCCAEVYGNTFANFPFAGIMIGGGRDFNVHNNYFYNCNVALSFDNRMEYWPSGNTKQLNHLYEVPFRNEIWKNAYPELYNLLDDEPKAPKNNIFNDNIMVGGNGVIVRREKHVEKYLKRSGNSYSEGEKQPLSPYAGNAVIVDVNG